MDMIATYEMRCDDGTTRTAEVFAGPDGWRIEDADGGHEAFKKGDAGDADAAETAALAAADADICRVGAVEPA